MMKGHLTFSIIIFYGGYEPEGISDITCELFPCNSNFFTVCLVGVFIRLHVYFVIDEM